MFSPININIILIILSSLIIFYIHNKNNYRNNIFNRFAETLAIFEKSKELAYQKTFKTHEGMLPIAERIYEGLISLPIYPKMTKEDIDYVANVLRFLLN